MNLSNIAKLLSICTIAIVFAFLINNYLTYAADWPGPLSFYNSFNFFSLTQILIYLFAVFLPILFLKLYGSKYDLSELADIFEGINGYIIRFGFWSVLIIGVIDAIISFLIIEGFLEELIGRAWNIKLSNNSFRAPYVHFPLLFISLFFASYFKSLNFYWLAFLVVIAEFQIVVLRFVFSYE